VATTVHRLATLAELRSSLQRGRDALNDLGFRVDDYRVTLGEEVASLGEAWEGEAASAAATLSRWIERAERDVLDAIGRRLRDAP
jgi:hypothetical protein